MIHWVFLLRVGSGSQVRSDGGKGELGREGKGRERHAFDGEGGARGGEGGIGGGEVFARSDISVR